jgi:hypothetical protein
MLDELAGKANKASVMTALKRKINREELREGLESRVTLEEG